MERLRKNEQNRHRKYFKKSRHLLIKPMEKLTDDEMYQLALMFEIAPRLADVYRIKNNFLAVIRSKSAAEGNKALADWLLSVEVMDLPEFHDCTKAYHNWFQEILNSMDVPWTSGYIEGCNNKTKVLNEFPMVCEISITLEREFCSVIHKNVPEPKLRHDLETILFWLYPNY